MDASARLLPVLFLPLSAKPGSCYRDPPASASAASSPRYASFVMLTVATMLTSARPPAVRGDRTYLRHHGWIRCAHHSSRTAAQLLPLLANRQERRTAPYCFGRLSAMPHEDQGSPPSVAVLAHGRARGCDPPSRVSRLKVCHLCTPYYYSPLSAAALHCWRSLTRAMSFSLPSCPYSTSLSSN